MERTIQLQSGSARVELFGPNDAHLRHLREKLNVIISARNGTVLIKGTEAAVTRAVEIIDKMQKKLIQRGSLDKRDINDIIEQVRGQIDPANSEAILVYSNRTVIEPFTKGQQEYIQTVNKSDLTFCVGPAGTGKTYLAVAMAVSMLKKNQVRKMILARPAVEAGERLGFLPGDIQAKVNPYLRPLFDSLEDMMDFAHMRKLMDMDVIEVIPLAFMRGRTLNQAVIICDEAQNTSPSQMLMVLTRLGRGSKMIITGDVTQMDLAKGEKSGLMDAIETLKGIKGIGYVSLKQVDIVRHKLVQNIVNAYDRKKIND